MSARGRGAVIRPSENYPTPAWCVHRLLEALPLPCGAWLEPCAGEGAIVKACRLPVRWTTWDLRPVKATKTGDALQLAQEAREGAFRVGLTNPPFSLAGPLLGALRPICEHVVMLLRLNWLASAARHPVLSLDMPDVFVLPNRPCFVNGKSDATEYAWMHWGPARRESGRVQLLALTPRAERTA
ncbi:MAG: hypothetical protein WC700_16280 [Gemmatimonadaceae bacterium]|jgi:hypothetical protein